MAVSATGLAGCVSSLADGEDASGPNDGSDRVWDGGSGTSDPLTEPPDGRSSLIDLETIDRTYALMPISYSADRGVRVELWFDLTATDDSPARLTGKLRNLTENAHTVDLEEVPAVGDPHSQTLSGYDDETRLHFAPTENNELATEVPDILQNGDGLWNVRDVDSWIQETVHLDPGEEIDLEYVLVGEPNLSDRPTGTYVFRSHNRSVQVAVWDTDSPGPEVESHFAGRTLPPLPNRGGASTQWYHEADESTPVYLEPAREQLQLDGAIDFELVINTREPTGCGYWNLYKLVEGEWFNVAPRAQEDDCGTITPGARKSWTLRAFNGGAAACDGGCTSGLTRGYLGPGTYAVVSGFGYPADETGALVELEGDPVSVETTPDATVERDGTEAVVTTDRYDDGVQPPDATLVVKRANDDSGGAGSHRVVAEQLMDDESGLGLYGALRDGIAAFDDGVERVEVRSDEHGVDFAVGYDSSARRVEFRGTTYDLTAEFEEE